MGMCVAPSTRPGSRLGRRSLSVPRLELRELSGDVVCPGIEVGVILVPTLGHQERIVAAVRAVRVTAADRWSNRMHGAKTGFQIQEPACAAKDLVGLVLHHSLSSRPPVLGEGRGCVVLAHRKVSGEPSQVPLRHWNTRIGTAVRRAVETVVEDWECLRHRVASIENSGGSSGMLGQSAQEAIRIGRSRLRLRRIFPNRTFE